MAAAPKGECDVVRPAPLILGLALIVLLAIPWGLVVAHRLADDADSPSP